MRIPKRRQKGFTLIELLIVVAILGALAAIVIPNVGRFIGRGEAEAALTEEQNIQSAVIAMMVDNQLSELPTPVDTVATNDMSAFPDTSTCGAGKVIDPDGFPYIPTFDKDGYILFRHDIKGDAAQDDLVNYTANRYTKGTYIVNERGTVTQITHGYE